MIVISYFPYVFICLNAILYLCSCKSCVFFYCITWDFKYVWIFVDLRLQMYIHVFLHKSSLHADYFLCCCYSNFSAIGPSRLHQVFGMHFYVTQYFAKLLHKYYLQQGKNDGLLAERFSLSSHSHLYHTLT